MNDPAAGEAAPIFQELPPYQPQIDPTRRTCCAGRACLMTPKNFRTTCSVYGMNTSKEVRTPLTCRQLPSSRTPLLSSSATWRLKYPNKFWLYVVRGRAYWSCTPCADYTANLEEFNIPGGLRNVIQNLRGIESYPDRAGSAKTREEYAQTQVIPPLPVEFMRQNNPVRCGTQLLNVLVDYHKFGLQCANHSPQIFVTAHLYNAMRQLGYLQQTWPALESLVTMHIRAIFRRALPTDICSLYKRALLAFGSPIKVVSDLSKL
jgi:hypothetical protein